MGDNEEYLFALLLRCGSFGAVCGACGGAVYGTILAPIIGTLYGFVLGGLGGYIGGVIGGALGGVTGWTLAGFVGGWITIGRGDTQDAMVPGIIGASLALLATICFSKRTVMADAHGSGWPLHWRLLIGCGFAAPAIVILSFFRSG